MVGEGGGLSLAKLSKTANIAAAVVGIVAVIADGWAALVAVARIGVVAVVVAILAVGCIRVVSGCCILVGDIGIIGRGGRGAIGVGLLSVGEKVVRCVCSGGQLASGGVEGVGVSFFGHMSVEALVL